jgi:ornithine--oxo-acid transaminase
MTETDSRNLTEELIEIEDRWGAHNYRPLDVVVERASGVWVYGVDGRRYLDCLSS